jgi:hypothetical protein
MKMPGWLLLVLLSRNTKPLTRLLGASAALVAFVLLIMVVKAPQRVHAGENDDERGERSKVEIGFAIAPVPLNLKGKNRELVGLGSYIVNAQSDCNGCHSHGPQTEYLPNGNPYLLRPPSGPYSGMKIINPNTYLGGGRDFGPVAGLTHLYSRNLTPDKTGRPEGGHTFDEFVNIMRTGIDYDHVHPSCTGAATGSCVVAPFNGALLQVMPWPQDQDMTDHDLRAIYEYLSAIPCIDTVVTGAPILRNDCPQ